jgi:lysozyme
MNRDKLKSQLAADEGYRGAMYFDTLGFATIGYGRMIDSKRGGGITKDEAAYLLNNDIDLVNARLNDALPWFKSLDDARQNVLINMGYNLSVAGLLKFAKTLDYVKRGDYKKAAEEMLRSTWSEQVGDRAKRLAKVMETGIL